jgi:hypothetical protein
MSRTRTREHAAALTLAVLTVLVVGAIVPVRAADAERTKLRCGSRDSVTVVKTREARIFREGTRYFACLKAVGRKWLLYDVDEEGIGKVVDEFSLPRLAGRYASFVLTSRDAFTGMDNDTAEIRRVDLRTGKRRTTIAFGSMGQFPRPPRARAVTDLVLSRHGHLAWILGANGIQLYARDSGGMRLLDEGPAIETRSLGIEISIIYWNNAGVERFARLM